MKLRLDADPIRRFTWLFALIWLLYDGTDLLLHGTWMQVAFFGTDTSRLVTVQVVCFVAEAALLAGFAPRILLAVLGLVRGWFAVTSFSLNDFLFFTVMCVWLTIYYPAPFLALRDRRERATTSEALGMLRLQYAWVYFATATLKMSAEFLSGAHLYVRHKYLELNGWPFAFILRHLDSRAMTQWLAIGTVVAELTLAILWLMYPRRRWLLLVACLIHIPAAILDNVFFFGFMMIAAAYCFSDAAPARAATAAAETPPVT